MGLVCGIPSDFELCEDFRVAFLVDPIERHEENRQTIEPKVKWPIQDQQAVDRLRCQACDLGILRKSDEFQTPPGHETADTRCGFDAETAHGKYNALGPFASP